jgi:insulysin
MSLTAGDEHEMNAFSTLSVTITLTKKGFENVLAVIQAVFKYAQMLQKLGPQQFVFEECQKVGNMKFKFLDKENAIDYVTKLA